MTAQEMQYHFELKINQFHRIEKSFTSTDIAMFLNQAQDDFINDRQPRFEKDEKTRLEIGSLIKSSVIVSFVSADAALHPNGQFAVLPSDYLYSIREMCTVGYTDCNSDSKTGTAKVLPVRHDEYLMNINSPFGKPYKELVWRMDYGITGLKKHELIHASDNTVTSYNLRYVRKPVAININTGVDCELHTSVHEEIVERAVNIALNTIPQTSKETKKQSE